MTSAMIELHSSLQICIETGYDLEQSHLLGGYHDTPVDSSEQVVGYLPLVDTKQWQPMQPKYHKSALLIRFKVEGQGIR